MKKLIFLALFSPLLGIAQEKGTHFDHESSWEQIKAKAKAENKYIFVDCFTTWCGPCKYMTANIFPQEKVGAFMNENFINVKVQMDKTPNDNEFVKSWYADADKIASQHQIMAYPTFLVFAPNGEIADRFVGGREADQLIEVCKDALVPERQYYTQLKKYPEHRNDTAFLRKLSVLALEKYDQAALDSVFQQYLAIQPNIYNPGTLDLIMQSTSSSKSKGFDILLKNADKVNKVMGKDAAENKLVSIATIEELRSSGASKEKVPDWAAFDKSVRGKYPRIADETVAKAKCMYYSAFRDDKETVKSITSYMKKFGHKSNPYELNEYAWTVFEMGNAEADLKEALNWSKRSIEKEENPNYIDTYANLLFKLGKKDEAIAWEEKALNAVPDNQKKTFAETLAKMKGN